MMLLEVDPNLVRPGWTPLVVVVLLGIVLFFLGRSMTKQFGRIDVPADHEPDPASTSESAGTDATSTGEDLRTPSDHDLRAPTPDHDLRAPTPDGGRDTPPDQR
jgi:hypothetical protein